MKTFALFGAIVLAAYMVGVATRPTSSAHGQGDQEQVRAAAVPLQRVAGRYVNSDGIKIITIKEVFAEDGWNGQLSFSPPVGDWASAVRCRISGTDLVVELPTSKGRVLVKMFDLHDPAAVVGYASPWDGVFHRTR